MRRSVTRAFALVAALACLAPPARGDDVSEFEKGRYAYLARNYDEADARFRAMLDPKTGTLKDRGLVAQARMYWAAVALARGRRDAADALFEQLLLDDPLFEPDPLSFPTDVINAFVDERAKIRDLLKAAAQERARRDAERKVREEAERRREAERLARLERLAGQETVVERHSRWLALVPFGVGQFQNGQRPLGWFFLATEAALVIAGAATLPVYFQQLERASDAYQSRDFVRAQQFLDRAEITRVVNIAAYGTFALTAVGGVAHAQATFVGERTSVRPRVLPHVAVTPTLGGATLSWSGTF